MTLDQLPAGLPMDDKIEAWVQRAMVLSRHCQDAWGRIDFGEQDNDEAERAELEAHLRTTPEGFVLMPTKLSRAMEAVLENEKGAYQTGDDLYADMIAASQESGT